MRESPLALPAESSERDLDRDEDATVNEPSTPVLSAHTVGRYEVRSELGRGAMGVVYEAFDPVLHRLVALKTIRLAGIEPSQAQHFEERFLIEARIAARLQHPGIVVVHDVGRDEATGTLYIALELLRGRTLQDILNDGPLPWPDAVHLTARVAHALEHAHAEGIIHRDIKPANVMVLPSGEPKIMDFGIARAENARATISAPGEFLGTPLYSSPEQTLGQPLDARSDIFSLGAVAYSALVGRAAFTSSSVPEIVRKVIHVDPPAPSTQQPGLPRALDAVLARALAKAPDARYATAAEFAVELECVLMAAGPLTIAAARPAAGTRDPIQEIQTLVSEPTLGGASPRLRPVAPPAGSPAGSPEASGSSTLAPSAPEGSATQAPNPATSNPALGSPPSPARPPAETPERAGVAKEVVSVESTDLPPSPMAAQGSDVSGARRPGPRPRLRLAATLATAVLALAVLFAWFRSEPARAPSEVAGSGKGDTSRSGVGIGEQKEKVLRLPEKIALGGGTSPDGTKAPVDPPAPRPTATGRSPASGTKPAPSASSKPRPRASSATPAPTPVPRPSEGEEPARLLVDFGHTLTEARFTVSVNDETVIYEEISARVKKTLGVGIVKGEFQKTVDVPPGKHRIYVKLEWDGKTRTDEIDGTFVSGKTRRLDVSLGRIRKNLDLEWK